MAIGSRFSYVSTEAQRFIMMANLLSLATRLLQLLLLRCSTCLDHRVQDSWNSA